MPWAGSDLPPLLSCREHFGSAPLANISVAASGSQLSAAATKGTLTGLTPLIAGLRLSSYSITETGFLARSALYSSIEAARSPLALTLGSILGSTLASTWGAAFCSNLGVTLDSDLTFRSERMSMSSCGSAMGCTDACGWLWIWLHTVVGRSGARRS